MIYKFSVETAGRSQMVDITSRVAAIVAESGVKSGLCTVFIPHTTAGVTINENADPDVVSDILKELDKVIPLSDGYRHFEGNSAAHIKAMLTGFEQTLIVENGNLMLGRWQDIYLCEYDGPRVRNVAVKIIAG